MPTQSVVAGKEPNQISSPQSTIVTNTLRATVRVITRKGSESSEPEPIRVTSQRSIILHTLRQTYGPITACKAYCPKRIAVADDMPTALRALRMLPVLSHGEPGPCLLSRCSRGRAQPNLDSSLDNRYKYPTCNRSGNNWEGQRIRRARSHPR